MSQAVSQQKLGGCAPFLGSICNIDVGTQPIVIICHQSLAGHVSSPVLATAGPSCRSGYMSRQPVSRRWESVCCTLAAAAPTRTTCTAASWSNGPSRACSPCILPSPGNRYRGRLGLYVSNTFAWKTVCYTVAEVALTRNPCMGAETMTQQGVLALCIAFTRQSLCTALLELPCPVAAVFAMRPAAGKKGLLGLATPHSTGLGLCRLWCL